MAPAVSCCGHVPSLLLLLLTPIFGRTASKDEERRITHEAAHFLIGYMLGIPIAGYNTDAIAPEVVLYDTRKGDRFDTADEVSLGALSLSEVGHFSLRYRPKEGRREERSLFFSSKASDNAGS